MPGTLSGKRAFVTGSSSGIGAETARWLAQAGAAVIVHGRNPEKIAAVEAELRQTGADVASVCGALDAPDDARAVAARALAHGPIDILVNNAGGYAAGYGSAQWFESRAEDWEKGYQANVVSAVAVTQEIVPGMIERGWGRVIQTASGIVDNNIPTIPDYKAAKTALVSFTVSLAIALRGTGVTSNAVSPGFTATEGLRAWIESEAAAKGWGSSWEEIEVKAAAALWPALVPRLGRTEDIARAVLFLAEPGGGFITGEHLKIDGGLALA